MSVRLIRREMQNLPQAQWSPDYPTREMCRWWLSQLPILGKIPEGALREEPTIALFAVGPDTSHREPILCLTHTTIKAIDFNH